jgi:hypothetical protein
MPLCTTPKGAVKNGDFLTPLVTKRQKTRAKKIVGKQNSELHFFSGVAANALHFRLFFSRRGAP